MPTAPTTLIESTRHALGPPVDQQRDAVRRLEHTGYRTAWTNEAVGGKDALVQIAVLLAATERMVFGTGIANSWARPPQTAHAAAALLAEAYPGRFVLGLGVGYPEQATSVGREFARALPTMRAYVEGMAAPPQPPSPDISYPRIIAANGPKMLALARELADGALPAMPRPDVTAQARQLLGPDKLLVVLVRSVIGQHASEVAATAREQLAVGADHVIVGLPLGSDFATGVDHLLGLTPVLVEVT